MNAPNPLANIHRAVRNRAIISWTEQARKVYGTPLPGTQSTTWPMLEMGYCAALGCHWSEVCGCDYLFYDSSFLDWVANHFGPEIAHHAGLDKLEVSEDSSL